MGGMSMNSHPALLAGMGLGTWQALEEIARLNDEAEAAQAVWMAEEEERLRAFAEQDTQVLDRNDLQHQLEHERAQWLGEEAV